MCELLAMSANTPTDIIFSFTGLTQRGGITGPHTDGWGVTFYEGKGCRTFKDINSSTTSEVASLLKAHPIKSLNVVAHIRQANRGKLALENTHPFVRELWGRNWTFAHNGQLSDYQKLYLEILTPIGETDSEVAFCWILEQLRVQFGNSVNMDIQALDIFKFIATCAIEIAKLGVFNMIITNGDYLMAFCGNHLHTLPRMAPFPKAELVDVNLSVDFKKETCINDKVYLVATKPLTKNETWKKLSPGDWMLLKNGDVVYQQIL